tara:strand:- start:17145 stop:19349 length:2205 start_codon:yes stop_codon:yes gene_type:complete
MVVSSESLLQSLNAEQQQAVLHTNGPMLIIAGPGSGKTRVITHRAAHLLLNGHLNKASVLAVTFTNKAASELKSRIGQMNVTNQERITSSTFHSFCARLLRTHGTYVGLDRNYTIYDSDDQLSAIKESMAIAEVDTKQTNPRSIQNLISKSKASGNDARMMAQNAETYFEELAATIYSKYEELLQRNNAADFDDLIFKAVDLLSNNISIRESYNYNYQQVMIDEFQDTNASQYKLTKLLVHDHQNLTVVGDPNQSIYSWRNADIKNILNFQDDFPSAKVISINQNYRSTPNILKTARNIITTNELNLDNEIFTKNPEGSPVISHEAFDGLDEAEFVITEAKQLTSGRHAKYKLKDIAVMYRVNAQSRVIEEACLKSSVKYRIVGGIQFYQRKEIKDLLSYLSVISNPADDISLVRAISNPGRGIGKKTIESLKDYSVNQESSMSDALKKLHASVTQHGSIPTMFNARSSKLLCDFHEIIKQLTEESASIPLIELIDQVLEISGLQSSILESSDKAQERWENVLEFRETAREFNTQNAMEGLTALLDRLALINDIDSYDESDDCLTLITLHQSKGLEFPVVFLIGLEEGLLPHSRSFDDHFQIEEERRLCYVGVTRAERLLYLTHAFRRGLMGQYGPSIKSRFIEGLETNKQIPHVKPVNTARVITKNGKKVEQSTSKPLPHIGQSISHNTFGEGIVLDVIAINEDFELTIQFSNGSGTKKLLHSFAPIKILKDN